MARAPRRKAVEAATASGQPPTTEPHIERPGPAEFRDPFVRREIQKAASSHESGDPQPSVQLRFSAASVDAIVRYPVQLSHAAEIDERVSRELLNVISAHASAAA